MIRAKLVTVRHLATRVRVTVDIHPDQFSQFNAMLHDFEIGLDVPPPREIKVNTKPAKVPTPLAPTPLEAAIQQANITGTGAVVTEITLAGDGAQYAVELAGLPARPFNATADGVVNNYEVSSSPDDDEGSPFDGAN